MAGYTGGVKTDNGLPDYLSKLDAIDQGRFARLGAVVTAVPVPKQISQLVFQPNQLDHPNWDDAASVFWQGVQGLYATQALTPGELPLVYWGFHSYNILARRSANGVLLTDRGVYVVDAGRDSWAMPIGAVDSTAVRASAASLVIGSATLDLTIAKRLLEPGDAEASALYLSTVLDAVQRSLGIEYVAEAPGSADEVLAASSFATDFQLPTRPGDAKKIAKLASKWGLPAEEPVLYALSSSTLAGVYGLAITATTLYSRDLMEPLDQTPRSEIAEITWVDEPKGFRVREGHLIPTLPAITEGNRDEFIAVLSRLLGR